MSVNFRTETLGASGLLELEDANFLFVLSNTNPLTLLFWPKTGTKASGGGQGSGGNELFSAQGAGFNIYRQRGWQKCKLTAVAGTVITFFYGYQSARDDITGVLTQIATIAGGSILASLGLASPNAPTGHNDVTVAGTTIDTTIAANAARKSIIIGSLSTNVPTTPKNLRVQQSPGTASANGIELQPGTNVTLYTQAAIAVDNPDASAQTYFWMEQL